MPAEFDPAWEYYVPDPEVAEAEGSGSVLRFPTRRDPRAVPRECLACGRRYNALYEDQRFCSTRCSGDARTPVRDPALFARMWNAGANRDDMADYYGILPDAVYKIRKRLGLPARRPGNHAANRNPPMRENLPDRRRSWTQKSKIPDFAGKLQTFYLTCGEYADGRLGEVWVEAQKENTFARGVLGAMARSASAALQNGTPPSEIVKMFRSLSFPPSGPVHAPGSDVRMCTSVADWVAQEIENVYVTGASARPVSGSVGLRPAAGEPGSEAAGAG